MSIRREKEEYIQSKNNMITAIYVSLDNVTGVVQCFPYLFLPKRTRTGVGKR
jgi:hypothetical protein